MRSQPINDQHFDLWMTCQEAVDITYNFTEVTNFDFTSTIFCGSMGGTYNLRLTMSMITGSQILVWCGRSLLGLKFG